MHMHMHICSRKGKTRVVFVLQLRMQLVSFFLVFAKLIFVLAAL